MAGVRQAACQDLGEGGEAWSGLEAGVRPHTTAALWMGQEVARPWGLSGWRCPLRGRGCVEASKEPGTCARGGQSHPVLRREVWAQEGADTRAPTCAPGGFSDGP